MCVYVRVYVYVSVWLHHYKARLQPMSGLIIYKRLKNSTSIPKRNKNKSYINLKCHEIFFIHSPG